MARGVFVRIRIDHLRTDKVRSVSVKRMQWPLIFPAGSFVRLERTHR